MRTHGPTGAVESGGTGHARDGGPLYFGRNVFDPGVDTLYRADEVVRLRPKAAEVLTTLLAHRGQVVSKHALCEAVWPNEYPGDDPLTRCISDLRIALGDDSKQPRYIATAHGRGYRFIAPVTSTPQPGAGVRARPPLVGRRDELVVLHEWWRAAQCGELTVGLIAADAGVGKSALVQGFVDDLQRSHSLLVARGQCTEQFDGGEAYLPLLDALAGLCRAPDGESVRCVLSDHAPSWLLEIPGLRRGDAAVGASRDTASAELMVGELVDALGALTATTPLVLICEDLQAADHSTTALLRELTRHPRPARALVIGTYRPGDTVLRTHPLSDVIADLRAAPPFRHLTLGPLSADAVGSYLAHRLAPDVPAQALTRDIHRRTQGNPRFVSTIIDVLVERDLLVAGDGVARCRQQLDRVAVPDAIRELITCELERLAPEDRALIALAAVLGVEFDAAAVLDAAGDDWPALSRTDVEDRLATLARGVGLLDEWAGEECHDGTATARYRFRCALYRECAGELPSPSRRAAARRRVAAATGDERTRPDR